MATETLYKKFVAHYLLWLALLAAALACFAVAIIIIDPLQIFHKSRLMPPDMLSENMREQAIGIIRHYDFDSLILGTSELENTSAGEAGEKLGGKFANLSLGGGTFYERSLLLNQAFQKKLKSVIYSLDDYYMYQVREIPWYPAREWTYLYDANPVNDLRRYATLQNLANLFRENKGLRKVDLNYPNAWFQKEEENRKFGGLENWVKHLEDPQVHDFLLKELPETAAAVRNAPLKVAHDLERERLGREHIDEFILKFAAEHPETEFYLIFPPYLRYRYTRWLKIHPEDYYLHQEMARYLVNKSQELSNIHIYGFEDQDFLDDVANYKDTVHYHKRINSLMLDAIAEEKHLLTPDNIEGYLEKSLAKAQNFDLDKLNAQAQELLKARREQEQSGMTDKS